MKKLIAIVIFSCFSVSLSWAQSDIDAFRFSQVNWQGTARFMGAGGAFGAVGAEYSALSINPAAIGIYKKSEVSFTPMVVSIFNTSSGYRGTTSNYLSSNYSLSNFGVVVTSPLENSPWKNVQFAIGYNRINDFNNSFHVEGISSSSIADMFADMANGTYYKDLSGELGLAFDTWAIDTFEGINTYRSLLQADEIQQKQSVITLGGIDEMNFTLGGNYGDKLYVGATLGVPFLKYTETITYEEENLDKTPREGNALDGLYRQTDLKVKGTGVNLKLGLIYQPASFFRIGAAFHTPTYYASLRETYTVKMKTTYDDGRNSGEMEHLNEFAYKLLTPFRATANMAFLINKRAFVSAEYEFTDYGMPKLFAPDYNFGAENKAIGEKYGASHALRIGAEVYLTEHFLLRTGYNYQSNPYKNNINRTDAHLAAVGIGFRNQSFFLDLAYNLRLSREDYWMYGRDYVERAENQYKTHRVALTVGYKF